MKLPGGLGADLGALKDITWKEMAIRFLFGCGISLAAGLVSMRFGPRVGGLFLAFPAILPASLTLIEEKEGDHAAMVDAVGAILGGVALGVFAGAAAVLVPTLPAVVALGAATLAWLLVAVSVYRLAVRVSPRRGRRADERPGRRPTRTKTA